MGWTKLFSEILSSSIWCEDDKTRLVWITMLAMKDHDGFVSASIPGLAHQAHVDIESCQAALAKLEGPDPFSRTQDKDGRRVERVDGGWMVLNHLRYRDGVSNDPSAVSARDRKRRQRERENTNQQENTENTENTDKKQIHNTDTDTDTASRDVTPCHVTKRDVTPCHVTKRDVTLMSRLSLPFTSDAFKTAWFAWEQHRKEKRAKLTPTCRAKQLKTMAELGETAAIAAIEYTINKGWTGLFVPPPPQPNRANETSAYGPRTPDRPSFDGLNVKFAEEHHA